MKHRYSHPTAYNYKKSVVQRLGIGGLKIKGLHGRMLLVLPAALLLVGAGGGIVLAQRGGPASVARKAVVKTQSPLNQALISTFGSKGIQSSRINATLTFSGPKIPAALNNLTLAGSVDRTGHADITITSDIAGTPVSLHEVRVDGTHQYSRIDGFQDVNTLQKSITDPVIAEKVQAVAPIFAALNGKSYAIDEQVIAQMLGAATGGKTVFMPGDVSRESLSKLYRAHPFVKQRSTLPDDEIENTPVQHVTAIIDKKTLQQFIVSAHQTGGPLEQLDQARFAQLTNIVASTDFNAQPFDVWMEKDTHYIRKFVATFATKGYNVKIAVTLSDINKALKPQVPAGTLSTDDMLTTLLPLMSEPAPQN